MRKNSIVRTEIGSTPFDIVRGGEEIDSIANLDEDKQHPLTSEYEEEEEEREEEFEEEEFEEEEFEEEEFEEEEESEEEEEESEEEEEYEEGEQEVEIETNVTKLLADRLKADGQLPEDFEVTEEMSAKEVEDAYRDFMYKKVSEEAESAAKQKLREEYGDDTVLNAAKKLYYGVTEEEIQLAEAYNYLSRTEASEEDENYEDIVKGVFEQYYVDKTLSPKEAKANALRDFEDGDVEELFKDRKAYFNNRAIEMEQQQKQVVEDRKRAIKEEKDASIQKINTILDSGTIDGIKYNTQEIETIRKSLFEKSEVIEVDGKRVRVTPYYKKKYERSKNEEQNLKDIADFILGYNLKSLSQKERKAARKKMVDDLNESIKVTLKPKRKKKRKVRRSSGGNIQRRAL